MSDRTSPSLARPSHLSDFNSESPTETTGRRAWVHQGDVFFALPLRGHLLGPVLTQETGALGNLQNGLDLQHAGSPMCLDAR